MSLFSLHVVFISLLSTVVGTLAFQAGVHHEKKRHAKNQQNEKNGSFVRRERVKEEDI